MSRVRINDREGTFVSLEVQTVIDIRNTEGFW